MTHLAKGVDTFQANSGGNLRQGVATSFILPIGKKVTPLKKCIVGLDFGAWKGDVSVILIITKRIRVNVDPENEKKA